MRLSKGRLAVSSVLFLVVLLLNAAPAIATVKVTFAVYGATSAVDLYANATGLHIGDSLVIYAIQNGVSTAVARCVVVKVVANGGCKVPYFGKKPGTVNFVALVYRKGDTSPFGRTVTLTAVFHTQAFAINGTYSLYEVHESGGGCPAGIGNYTATVAVSGATASSFSLTTRIGTYTGTLNSDNSFTIPSLDWPGQFIAAPGGVAMKVSVPFGSGVGRAGRQALSR